MDARVGAHDGCDVICNTTSAAWKVHLQNEQIFIFRLILTHVAVLEPIDFDGLSTSIGSCTAYWRHTTHQVRIIVCKFAATAPAIRITRITIASSALGIFTTEGICKMQK